MRVIPLRALPAALAILVSLGTLGMEGGLLAGCMVWALGLMVRAPRGMD